MTKPLSGAAEAARDAKVLRNRAAKAMTTGHPDHIAALLVEAEQAYPIRNPEPLRDDIREALHFERLCERYGFIGSWDDDASHAAEERRQASSQWHLASDEWADLPVMGA